MNGSGLLLLSNLFWTLEITKETADEEQCFCNKKAFSNFNTSIKSFQAPHCPHKQEQLGMLAGYQMHISVSQTLLAEQTPPLPSRGCRRTPPIITPCNLMDDQHHDRGKATKNTYHKPPTVCSS